MMAQSPAVAIMAYPSADSIELELQLPSSLLTLEQRMENMDRDVEWLKEALCNLMRQQGLEVPPFLVAVVREEDRAKTVSQEVILPLENTLEHVVSESLQLSVVPDEETKLRPVEHFVKHVGGESTYGASSESESFMGFMGKTMSFVRRFKVKMVAKEYYKVRKKKNRFRDGEPVLGFARLLGVPTAGMKRQQERKKKTTCREMAQACKSFGMFVDSRLRALNAVRRVGVEKRSVVDTGVKRGSRFFDYGFQSHKPINQASLDDARMVEDEMDLMDQNIDAKRVKESKPEDALVVNNHGANSLDIKVASSGEKMRVAEEPKEFLLPRCFDEELKKQIKLVLVQYSKVEKLYASECQIQAEARGDELIHGIMLHGPATCHKLSLFQEQNMSNKRSMENLGSDELSTCILLGASVCYQRPFDPGGMGCDKAKLIWLVRVNKGNSRLLEIVKRVQLCEMDSLDSLDEIKWLMPQEHLVYTGVTEELMIRFTQSTKTTEHDELKLEDDRVKGVKRLMLKEIANRVWDCGGASIESDGFWSLLLCLSVHNRSLGAEVKQMLWFTHPCLEITELSRFEKPHGMYCSLRLLLLVVLVGCNAYGQELLIVVKKRHRSHALFSFSKLLLLYLEDKVCFQKGSNSMWRVMVSETEKKKVKDITVKKIVAAGNEKENRDIELIMEGLIKREKYQELLSLHAFAEPEQELNRIEGDCDLLLSKNLDAHLFCLCIKFSGREKNKDVKIKEVLGTLNQAEQNSDRSKEVIKTESEAVSSEKKYLGYAILDDKWLKHLVFKNENGVNGFKSTLPHSELWFTGASIYHLFHSPRSPELWWNNMGLQYSCVAVVVGLNERRWCDDHVQGRSSPTEDSHVAANKLTLFYLEDKIVLQGGSIDRSRILVAVLSNKERSKSRGAQRIEVVEGTVVEGTRRRRKREDSCSERGFNQEEDSCSKRGFNRIFMPCRFNNAMSFNLRLQ